ncbi:MAG: hypothetical protein HYU66_05210 [Armatimonadetes bacterium]|nr:hypothetical protein [Armatimonadota bacterium]
MRDASGIAEVFPRDPRYFWRAKAIHVGPNGLGVEYGGGVVTTPWREVLELQWRPHGVVFRTARQRIVVDRAFGDWRRLAWLAKQHLASGRSDRRSGTVPPEEIARSLGIPADGFLVCRPPGDPWNDLVVLAIVVVLLALVAVLLRIASFLVEMLQAAVVAVALLMLPSKIVADAHGLVVRLHGHTRRLAWSEIRGVVGDEGLCRVETTCGTFRISTGLTNGEILLTTIRALAAANREGYALPDQAPPSDAAISRMTGEPDASAERGISRTE